MRTLLVGLCVWSLCLGLCSCGSTYSTSTTYGEDRDEFDSLASFSVDGDDPTDPTELYKQHPLRRSTLLRLTDWMYINRLFEYAFFMGTHPSFVENPAGLSRRNFIGMSHKMDGALDRSAEVAIRLLWIYEFDLFHVLNQVEALSAGIRILERDGIDPLSMPVPDLDRKSAIKLAERDLGIIQSLWPADRSEAISDSQRDQYSAALKSLTRAPFMPLSVQRRLIAKLLDASRLEPDRELAVATDEALRRAIHQGLTGALYLGRIQREIPLRIATIRGFNRLSGSKAVAFCLAYLADPPNDKVSTWQFDRLSAPERRLLIGLCGQLREPEVYEPYIIRAGAKPLIGPKPIEFLYGRVRLSPPDDMNLIALEAMAHCLDHRVEQESDWADAWWLEYSLSGTDAKANAGKVPVGRQ